MRKTVLIILSLCLVLCAVSAGSEEAMTVEETMDFFSGVYGNMAFALPGFGSVVWELDYPGAWTDSCQIFGQCVQDGTEFQFRCGNIEGLIGRARDQAPEMDPDEQRLQALLNYGMFYPNLYDAQIGEISHEVDSDTGNISAAVAFAYPDTPGEAYQCLCLLSGTRAMTLVIQACEHTPQVAEKLRFVTEQERTEFLEARSQATWQEVMGIGVTFPGRPVVMEREDMLETALFCADFTLLEVNYLPVAMDVQADDEARMEGMLGIAKKMLVPFGTETVNDPVLTVPREGTLQLDFMAVDESILGQYGPAFLCRIYAGMEGICEIYAADTETGRAFLESAVLTGQGEQPAAKQTGQILPAAAGTLTGFRTNLEDLLDQGAFGTNLKPGNFSWSGPVFSGGEWMRILYTDQFYAAAQILLDSSGDDAAIRQIRVLNYDLDTQEGRKDFLCLAQLCEAAFLGSSTDPEPERIDVEQSEHIYERIVLTPETEVPQKESIPEPADGAPIQSIPLSGVTAALFEERCERLAPLVTGLEFSHYMTQTLKDGNDAQVYVLGDVVIILYLGGTGDTAPAELAVVFGAAWEDAPQVLGATMLSYAALTGLPETDTVVMSWVLMECPRWDQLCDLWPLLSDGHVCAHLQDDEENQRPMGFVSGIPDGANQP